MLEWRLADGTLLGSGGHDLGALQAGTASEPLVLDISYRWGDPEPGDRLQDLVFRLATEDPQRPGVGVMQGVAPQDQLWARARFVDHDNSEDRTQAPFVTGWTSLGAFAGLPFPSLHAGCSRRLEIVWEIPGAASGAYVFLPTVDHSGHSRALAAPVPSGIVTGIGDRSRSGLVRGGTVTVSEPPDAQVHVAPHQLLDRGELRGLAGADLSLDRFDGDGAALADGEAYRARLVATAAGPLVRKGPLGADPSPPPLEVGDIASLGILRIEAPPGGGPPVLVVGDLEETPRYDRFALEAGDGLELYVHAGDAYGGGTWRFWRRRSDPLPLSPSSVHYLWQLRTGLYELTPDETPPEPTALGPWAEIETDADRVVRLEDRRIYAESRETLTLSGPVPSSPGVVGRVVVTREMQFEKMWMAIDAQPTEPLVFDLQREGESILVSGTEPTFDVESELTFDKALPSVSRLRSGTVIELVLSNGAETSPMTAHLGLQMI